MQTQESIRTGKSSKSVEKSQKCKKSVKSGIEETDNEAIEDTKPSPIVKIVSESCSDDKKSRPQSHLLDSLISN